MQTTNPAPVNGASLYYEVRGRGHPLLLLHAGVADSRMWDDQFADFSQLYQTIRYDLRGFGRSSMPPGPYAAYEDVAGLLDYLQIDQAHLLGISNGGRVALDFALAYPARVTALILAVPSVGGDTPSARIREFWNAEEAALARGDLGAATELNLRLWVDGPQRRPDQVDPGVRARVHDMQLQAFQIPVPDDAQEIGPATPAIERLDQVQAPTLVITGALDLEEKVALAALVARAIPNAAYSVIPGAAHLMSMEQPDAFNRLVLSFLAKH
jgi:pimeloyl-ACP methyl ester carboxylesterase